jgi:L-serine dehydratase
MESIKEIFRIGLGPSSSHTMGPRKAAEIFRNRNQNAVKYRVILYGSLAATGKGHLTDLALINAFMPHETEIIWNPDTALPLHPNGMDFQALDQDGLIKDSWRVYSIGGARRFP